MEIFLSLILSRNVLYHVLMNNDPIHKLHFILLAKSIKARNEKINMDCVSTKSLDIEGKEAIPD